MKITYSESFRSDYHTAPLVVQRAFDRKILFLEKNLRHPSLHAKKYDETGSVWQARVNRDWRFYFKITDDAYYLTNITKHPK